MFRLLNVHSFTFARINTIHVNTICLQQINCCLNKLQNLSFRRTAGTIETAPTLHDQTIEENNDKNNTENEVDHTPTAIPVNAPDRFFQLRKFSMAFYYGWQILCLLIFIFTAYETLQNV